MTKPFIHTSYIETVTDEVITEGTTPNKVVQTMGDGYIPEEVFSPEHKTKVRTLNGMTGNITIVQEGFVRVQATTDDGGNQLIKVGALAPNFYPQALCKFIDSASVTVDNTYREVASQSVTYNYRAHIHVMVSAKVSQSGLVGDLYSARLILNNDTNNQYEISGVMSDILSLVFTFRDFESSSITVAVQMKAESGGGTPSLGVDNLSLNVMVLPAI